MIDRNLPITTVLLDFGGVIAEEGFREGLKTIAAQNGKDAEEFFITARDIVYESGYVTGTATEAEFWSLLRRATGISGSDAALRNEILSRFVLRPWMMDLVREWSSRGITTAILSDQVNWLEELDRVHDFFATFDHVFNSYRLHISKKDPAMFDLILQILGKPAQDALFIDDSPGNVQRAESRGLHSIVYENKRSFFKQLEQYRLI